MIFNVNMLKEEMRYLIRIRSSMRFAQICTHFDMANHKGFFCYELYFVLEGLVFGSCFYIDFLVRFWYFGYLIGLTVKKSIW